MTIRIDYVRGRGRRRIISDDENPRIYRGEWRCYDCGMWVASEEVVWAAPDGELDTDCGLPWCVSCLPAQKEGE